MLSYRFEREPQLLAAWARAKHVAAGPQVEPVAVPESPGVTPAAEGPGTGEVKPAA